MASVASAVASGAQVGAPQPSRLLTGVLMALLMVMAIFVTFPMQIPGGPSGLRGTEFVGLAANLALILALLSGAALHRAVLPIAVAGLLTIPWIVAEIASLSTMAANSPARFALVRWVMGLATGYWLAVLMDDERHRRAVGVAMMLGLIAGIATIVQDAMTFDPAMLATLTPGEEEIYGNRWVGGAYRAGGIFGHPNNAAATALLLVPLIIGFVEERRLPQAALLIAAGAIVAVFICTRTRGGPAVGLLLLGWHLMRGSPGRRTLILLVLAFSMALYAVLGVTHLGAGEDSIFERFSDRSAANENLDGRIFTVLSALQLTLENPLGLGSSYLRWIDATHNAYLQLALMAGLPLALFVTWRLSANALGRAARGRVTESWTATYIAGAFMFENLFLSPAFTLFVAWLLWRRTHET